MTTEPLVFEKIFNAPVSSVWAAITDKDAMKKWYFDLSDFKPEVGFEFTFDGEADCVTYKHICVITEVEENKKLTYSWSYEGLGGKSYVTFELFEEGSKTKLRLTHNGLETFSKHGPDFAKTSFSGGWTAIIGTNLKNYLEGTTN